MPEALTLAQAVAVLNEHRHNDGDGWTIQTFYTRNVRERVKGPGVFGTLAPFDVIAIAMAYQAGVTPRDVEVGLAIEFAVEREDYRQSCKQRHTRRVERTQEERARNPFLVRKRTE